MMQFKYLSLTWIRSWFDRLVEKSWQRKANRLFDKSKVQHRDGDNT
jgi:hypothetical protein